MREDDRGGIRKIEELVFRLFMLALLILGGLRIIMPDVFEIIEVVYGKPTAQSKEAGERAPSAGGGRMAPASVLDKP